MPSEKNEQILYKCTYTLKAMLKTKELEKKLRYIKENIKGWFRQIFLIFFIIEHTVMLLEVNHFSLLGPLLLTWNNFNPSTDK